MLKLCVLGDLCGSINSVAALPRCGLCVKILVVAAGDSLRLGLKCRARQQMDQSHLEFEDCTRMFIHFIQAPVDPLQKLRAQAGIFHCIITDGTKIANDLLSRLTTYAIVFHNIKPERSRRVFTS